MRLLKPVAGIPPHINYCCAACEMDFSSAERTPYFDTHGRLAAPFFCSVCASTENRRREA